MHREEFLQVGHFRIGNAGGFHEEIVYVLEDGEEELFHCVIQLFVCKASQLAAYVANNLFNGVTQKLLELLSFKISSLDDGHHHLMDHGHSTIDEDISDPHKFLLVLLDPHE
jgi:hypothetical protein